MKSHSVDLMCLYHVYIYIYIYKKISSRNNIGEIVDGIKPKEEENIK